jgi:hypothetical protein
MQTVFLPFSHAIKVYAESMSQLTCLVISKSYYILKYLTMYALLVFYFLIYVICVCVRARSGVDGRACMYVCMYVWAHSGLDGQGTMLQARRSWVRFPMRSLGFSFDLILPAAKRAWGQLNL